MAEERQPSRPMTTLKAPFPYFGGKSRIAGVVWEALGDVGHYVEPFAGSLAVLLARPAWHKRGVETVNDIDHYLVNFWRALRAAPDEVAYYADWPPSEADVTARHIWLVNEGRERIANMEADPEAYDAKVAGWWVWGLSCWIGGGWCSGNGSWTVHDGKLVRRDSNERGVKRQRIHLGDAGQGVNRQLVHAGGGRGVNRKLIHLGDAGKGVNRQILQLKNAGEGVNRKSLQRINPGNGNDLFPRNEGLYDYLRALAKRLADVRICCGDWSRVVTAGSLSHGTSVGIFFDPPYAQRTGRDMGCYNHDSECLSDAVRKWCLANGDNPRYRIVLCGYEGEHDMPESWRKVAWAAKASYKTHRGDQNGNRFKERLWLSPHCLQAHQPM